MIKDIINFISRLLAERKQEEPPKEIVKKEEVRMKKEEQQSVDINLLHARDEKEDDGNEIRDIQFKNDNDRLKKEFNDLSSKNKPLKDLLLDLNLYTNTNFNKPIMITMIFRTQAEQDYLYRNNPKYKKKKFKSPHQFWHAVDLRSRTFSKEEINKIVKYLNDKYNKENYYKFTALYHTVGSGLHFHIQLYKTK